MLPEKVGEVGEVEEVEEVEEVGEVEEVDEEVHRSGCFQQPECSSESYRALSV